VEHWRAKAKGVPTIVFCAGTGASKKTRDEFRAAEIAAEHVDGSTPAEERDRIMAGLGAGIDVVCSVDLISEGFDCPNVGCVILLRPTKSLTIYLQQVGRALRVGEGKDKAVVLDHAGNSLRHGLPDSQRAWSLEGRPKEKREKKASVKRCPECGTMNPVAAELCIECDAEFPGRKPPQQVKGDLVEVERRAIEDDLRKMSYGQLLRYAAGDPDKLRHIARIRRYKSGWVTHRLSEFSERRSSTHIQTADDEKPVATTKDGYLELGHPPRPPLQAIREKCIDCSGGSQIEVKPVITPQPLPAPAPISQTWLQRIKCWFGWS
jgi:DNA repair protein RadD